MSESIGKALANAIKDPSAAGSEKTGRHAFRNRNRRKIFSILTLTPCISAQMIARKSGLVQNTVKWHLEKLMISEYVIKHSEGRSVVYFPQGLIDNELVALFCTINHRTRGEVYNRVLHAPGASQSELSSSIGVSRNTVGRALGSLSSLGLVSTVEDGAFLRYYPTGLLAESAEGFYRHSKDFSEYIMKRLGQEGGKTPTIVKKDLDRMVVEMGATQERFTMEIGVNPFMTR